MEDLPPLPDPAPAPSPDPGTRGRASENTSSNAYPASNDGKSPISNHLSPITNPIRTALCAEARDGNLYLFLPPLKDNDSFVHLLSAVERTATPP